MPVTQTDAKWLPDLKFDFAEFAFEFVPGRTSNVFPVSRPGQSSLALPARMPRPYLRETVLDACHRSFSQIAALNDYFLDECVLVLAPGRGQIREETVRSLFTSGSGHLFCPAFTQHHSP